MENPMTDQVPQNPEDEDHTLSTKLRYVALNNFEQPILDFANAALESGRLIVKRAAVAVSMKTMRLLCFRTH